MYLFASSLAAALFGEMRILARRASLNFPLAFGLVPTLLYWGRPAGYGFNYLELVVAIAVWPSLVRWQRLAVLVVLVGIMGSRWWAFVETLRGENLSLLTMQTAAWPWETLGDDAFPRFRPRPRRRSRGTSGSSRVGSHPTGLRAPRPVRCGLVRRGRGRRSRSSIACCTMRSP